MTKDVVDEAERAYAQVKSASEAKDALSSLLAAEADYLHATGWKPRVLATMREGEAGEVRWDDPRCACIGYSQIDAVRIQRRRDE